MTTKSIIASIANHLKSKYKKSLSLSQCFVRAHKDVKNKTYIKECIFNGDVHLFVAYNFTNTEGKTYQCAYLFVNGKVTESTGSFPYGPAIEVTSKIEVKGKVFFTYKDNYRDFANFIDSLRNKHFLNRAFSNMSDADRKYWTKGT